GAGRGVARHRQGRHLQARPANAPAPSHTPEYVGRGKPMSNTRLISPLPSSRLSLPPLAGEGARRACPGLDPGADGGLRNPTAPPPPPPPPPTVTLPSP